MDTFFVNNKKVILAEEDGSEYLSYLTYHPEYEIKIPLRPVQDMSLTKEAKHLLAEHMEGNVKVEDGHIDLMGMTSLGTAVKEFSFPKFYVLLKQYRQSSTIERRSVQGYDEERYMAAQAEFVQGLRDILRPIILEVLAEVNISEEEYKETIKYYNLFDLDYFEIFVRTGWTDSFHIFHGKKLTPDERAEIIKAQTQLYKDEKENIPKLKERHPNLSHVNAVELIESKIDDQIYQKYNVETEDFIKYIYSDTNDSEQEARTENSTAKSLFNSIFRSIF